MRSVVGPENWNLLWSIGEEKSKKGKGRKNGLGIAWQKKERYGEKKERKREGEKEGTDICEERRMKDGTDR